MIADEKLADTLPGNDREQAPAKETTRPLQENDATKFTEVTEMPNRAEQTATVAGLSADGALPGNSDAAATPSGNHSLAAVDFEGRELVELRRSGSIVSAGAIDDATYGYGGRWALTSPDAIQAAAPPDTLKHWTNLSRAQAAHARLYLDTSGKNDD